jgi:hypothetical protein
VQQNPASVARYFITGNGRRTGSSKSIRLVEKIAVLKQQMQQLRVMEAAVKPAPDQQISLTDPDARSMATSGKGTGIVG